MGAVNEQTRVGTAVRDGEKHVWGYHQESEPRSIHVFACLLRAPPQLGLWRRTEEPRENVNYPRQK